MNEFTNFVFLYHFVSFSLQTFSGRGEVTNNEQIFLDYWHIVFTLCTEKGELDISKAKLILL